MPSVYLLFHWVGARLRRVLTQPLVTVSPCHLIPSQAQLALDATLDTPGPASLEPDHGSTTFVRADPLT